MVWEGAFGMPPVYRDEVGGVPIFWTNAPGAPRVSLMFNVGRAHEPLPVGGVSHVVEHLTLSSLDRPDYQFNGQVQGETTLFFARTTSAEELTDYLNRVTAALSAVPCQRLSNELTVLRTEAASRSAGILDELLNLRFGATGFGRLMYEEFGLRTLQEAAVRSWAEQNFCAENAAIWMTIPPPRALSLSLPRGARNTWPASTPVVFEEPAVFHHQRKGVVAIGGVVPRSTAAASLSRILNRRLQQRLRDDLGVSYQVPAGYLRLDGSLAHLFFAADCLPEHAPRVYSAARLTIEACANAGTTVEELNADIALFERAPGLEPDSVLGVLHGFAYRHITGQREVLTPDVLLEEMRAVTPSEHAELARNLLARSLWALPAGTKAAPSDGLREYPVWSSNRIDGKRYSRRGTAKTVNDPRELYVGQEGVSLLLDESRLVTVRYDQCDALLCWDDGQRRLVGRDGFQLPFVPATWRRGDDARATIDARVESSARVPMGAPRTPMAQTRPWNWRRLLSTATVMLWIGAALCLINANQRAAGPLIVDPTTGQLIPGPAPDTGVYWAAAVILAAMSIAGRVVLRLTRRQR